MVSVSSIHLTLCSRPIAPHLDLTVLSDLYGNDHYPVLIHISTPWPALEYSLHWILAKANWTIFKQSINLPREAFEGVNNKADCFIVTVISCRVSHT